ncbi:MAG TPA: ATP-binding protein [Anaerolineae bacterium]|nr:MAG: Divergent AAA domain protein [Chloroflexi bacterium ADurb.Bin222]HOC20780.1 ATP-binding protein [Anaerolineae bacterium]HQM13783.1 ATP-binding protein [Anaerolineae bacterium]
MPVAEKLSSSQLVALLPEANPELLAETMVAFANADGGTLYLGLSEEGQPTGDIYPEEINGVFQQAEARCHPPIVVEWQQTEAGGAFIFVGHIRRSPELHTLRDGRVLVRTGAENRPLRGEQVRQLASTRSVGDYEAEAAPGAARAELDEHLLEEFVGKWEERQGRPLTQPLEDFLVDMGWLTAERVPTIAGLLLFGRHPQSFIPHSGLTFVRFEGVDLRQETGMAGYGRREEINGALPQIIQRTWEILQEELRRGAIVRSLQREEMWLYPPTAIREALVNAVAHRDYRLHGRGIEVRMFADRLEVISPGGLPGFITLDNIVEEHFSRNPRIVNGLFQWRYIEELGLGVDVMIEAMINAGHPPPEFRETPFSFTVIFRNVVERPPVSGVRLTMNERQDKALAFIQRHGRITNRDYQDLCPEVSPETLRLDLADLVERGVLLKIGAKRGTYYILR